jgi:hypothetical protein
MGERGAMTTRRVDLETIRPFLAGWREQIARDYSQQDIDRLIQSSREHRALAEQRRIAARRAGR